jgi:hypothetical protein
LLTPAEVVPYLASLGLKPDQVKLLITLVDDAGVAYEKYQTKTPAGEINHLLLSITNSERLCLEISMK